MYGTESQTKTETSYISLATVLCVLGGLSTITLNRVIIQLRLMLVHCIFKEIGSAYNIN